MKRSTLLAFASAGAVLAVQPVASAQQNDAGFFQRDRYQAVNERYQEDFDPEPVRLGTFVATPSLELGAESNDNVFADEANEESDIIVRIMPTVDLRSDWSRHELGGRVQIEHNEYTDLDSESATNARGELRGRLDVSREVDFNGTVFATDEVEARRSVANLDVFEEPVNFQTVGARTQARWTRDRLRARAGYEVTDYSYDDVPLVGGGSADNSERDYTFHRVRSRVSYAVSPDVALFGQVSATQRNYSEQVLVDGTLENRDADGVSIEVGANFELPQLIRGDVAIGYLEDDKESDVFADIDGLSVEAEVQWFPTRLTTVTFDAGRNVIDPGLATSGSATATDFGVRVDHELRRNVVLFAEGGLRTRDYEDIDRDDDLTDLRLGATYKLNKRFHLDGYVARYDRDSNNPQGEFEQNILGLALRVFP
ncbi:MAG: outer membrane beta-barrel protein [Pseudomonadota bacterium]